MFILFVEKRDSLFRYDINGLYRMCSFRGGFSFFSIKRKAPSKTPPKKNSDLGQSPKNPNHRVIIFCFFSILFYIKSYFLSIVF